MKTKTETQTGVLQSFNVSPKGSFEGLLMEISGETVQINFPREWGGTIAEMVKPGDKIQADVEAEETHGHPSHAVYRLLTLKAGRKKPLSLAETNGDDSGAFSGTVERLNYALHGEVNGAILNNGDFLHVKPHGAAALELEVGMQVKGTGTAKPMVGGHRVIEADQVNGVSLEKKQKAKKKA